jgi:nucleoside-triphosphatase THEP1
MNDHQGRVLLVTGVPGSGKTTIMKKVAAALSGKRIRGFVTGEIREAGRRVGFELSMFTGDKRLLAHIDIDSRDRVGRYGVDVATLDEITEEALVRDDGTDIYLVDEIGKMECFSVKNRARDLLRAVASGGDVSIARVHDFARAVIEMPTFQVAQELLHDVSPEFAVRKALELASMVLSADDGAAESVSQRRSAMKKDRSGTLAR